MPALILTDTTTKNVVRLAVFYDLPKPPIIQGGKIRRSVKRYTGRNQASVQVLGEQFTPIQLQCKWDGMQSGQRERARLIHGQLNALHRAGNLIRLEWLDIQYWGLLDYEGAIFRDDLIIGKITFEPLYSEDPAFLRVLEYAPRPLDTGSLAEEQAAAAAVQSAAAPAQAADSLAVLAVETVAAAQGHIAAALAQLGGIVSGVELATGTTAAAASSLRSALTGIKKLRARLKTAELAATSSAPGVAANEVRSWVDDEDTILRALMETLLAWLGQLTDLESPPASISHAVRDGDTLPGLAVQYLGDVSRWIDIADANDLPSSVITPGQILAIPEARK